MTDAELAMKINSLIDSNLNITCTEICASLCLGYHQAQKRYKRFTGNTMDNYRIRVATNRITQLVEQTHYNVTDIADKLDVPESKVKQYMKRAHGLTVSQYRRRHPMLKQGGEV